VLHIKLPKGKVSAACEVKAEECSRRIMVANDRYRNELERWRKEGGFNRVEGPMPPDKPRDFFVLTEERHRLHQMADMAKHSTGDVYVSPELWNLIKGVY
jgi:hypothetical protein